MGLIKQGVMLYSVVFLVCLTFSNIFTSKTETIKSNRPVLIITEEKIFTNYHLAVVNEWLKIHLHDVRFDFCHTRTVFCTCYSTTCYWKGNFDILLPERLFLKNTGWVKNGQNLYYTVVKLLVSMTEPVGGKFKHFWVHERLRPSADKTGEVIESSFKNTKVAPFSCWTWPSALGKECCGDGDVICDLGVWPVTQGFYYNTWF